MRVLPTKWRRKPAGLDMERNYATVTLCIVGDNDILDRCARDLPLPRQATREAAWLPRLAACQKSFFSAPMRNGGVGAARKVSC